MRLLQKKVWQCIMGASKKNKSIKQKEFPQSRDIVYGGNPDEYYSKTPSWIFGNADNEMWIISKDSLWDDIMPKLKALESKRWGEILVSDKKFNHSIKPNNLNKAAQDRLIDKHVEADAIISLRISGNHRLYGYMSGSAFNILWYDVDHGDNDTCVCRSYLKHT